MLLILSPKTAKFDGRSSVWNLCGNKPGMIAAPAEMLPSTCNIFLRFLADLNLLTHQNETYLPLRPLGRPEGLHIDDDNYW